MKRSLNVEETRAYYDDFSRRYDDPRRSGYHALIDELEVRAIRDLVVDRDVLEVGCGTGLILERLAPLARRLEGVDLSPGMLMRARARGFAVREASATELPFDTGSFDVVVSFKVLPHVERLDEALAEMVRVTRPGGYVVAEFYNRWSLRYLSKRLAGARSISASRTESDVYTRWVSPAEVRRLVPAGASLTYLRGVRVVTPAAGVHRVPGLRGIAAHIERRCVASPLRFAAGFLVAVFRRHGAQDASSG